MCLCFVVEVSYKTAGSYASHSGGYGGLDGNITLKPVCAVLRHQQTYVTYVHQTRTPALRDSRTCLPSTSIWTLSIVPHIAPVPLPSLESHPGLIVNSFTSIAPRPGSNSFIAYIQFCQAGPHNRKHKTYSQFAATDDFLHTSLYFRF